MPILLSSQIIRFIRLGILLYWGGAYCEIHLAGFNRIGILLYRCLVTGQ
jgi:hypothetical protein